MMERKAFVRSSTTGNWIQGRCTGGVAVAMNWNRLEDMMRRVGTLFDDEFIERFEVDENGVTAYIDERE